MRMILPCSPQPTNPSSRMCWPVSATTTTFTDTAALTVLDGVVPNPLPPGNLLFVGPLRSSPLFSVNGQLQYPTLRPVPGGDPLLQNVSVAEVNVLRSAQIPKPLWAHTIIDSDGGPVLFAGEQDGRRIAVLGFNLRESDLPLQVAFPILLSNLVGYLAPGQGGAAALNLMNPAESRVEPRKQLPIFQTGGRAVAASSERSGRSELWRWLAALG